MGEFLNLPPVNVSSLLFRLESLSLHNLSLFSIVTSDICIASISKWLNIYHVKSSWNWKKNIQKWKSIWETHGNYQDPVIVTIQFLQTSKLTFFFISSCIFFCSTLYNSCRFVKITVNVVFTWIICTWQENLSYYKAGLLVTIRITPFVFPIPRNLLFHAFYSSPQDREFLHHIISLFFLI